VEGVVGVWKDLTDNVNFHGLEPDRAGAQHRQGHHRVANGDLSQKITVDVKARCWS